MIKIRDVLRMFAGEYFTYEIYYHDRRDNSYDFFESPDLGRLKGKDDINILELWAYSYETVDKETYDLTFSDSVVTFEDFFGKRDDNDQVLIIYLSDKSYEILTDPSIKKVSDLRMDYLGKFNQMVLLREIYRKGKCRYGGFGDNEEDYFDHAASGYSRGWDLYDDYDDYDEPDRRSHYELIEFSPKKLDTFYAREAYLCNEEDFRNCYGNDTIHGDDGQTWWDKESFKQHFGISDAKILVVKLV